MEKKAIFLVPNTNSTQPYSPAVQVNGLIFISGQLPLDDCGNMPSDIIGQTHQVMQNIAAILETAGSCMNNIVKTTVFITEMSSFADMNKIYSTYFTDILPARAAVEVCSLAKGAMVEIDAIALVQSSSCQNTDSQKGGILYESNSRY